MVDEVEDSPAPRPPSTRLRVDEVMGRAVAVAEGTTLQDVAALMLAEQVQAVLVVNPQAEVVGVVTERQLTLDGHYLRLACAEVPEIEGRSVTSLDEIDAACIAATTSSARDVMERRLMSACADEPVGAAVERMLQRDAEYAVVHQGSLVVGMLGSHDLLRKVAGERTIVCTPPGALLVDGQPVHLCAEGGWKSLISHLMGDWK